MKLDRKQPNADGSQLDLTRRTFIQAGAAGLALAAAAPSVLASSDTPVAETRQKLGAIYSAALRADAPEWSAGRRVSALGRYDSGDVGVIDTHIVWAKGWGLSFFLSSSPTDDRRDYRTANQVKLFDRADRNKFNLALLLTPDEAVTKSAESRRAGKTGREAHVRAAAAWLQKRLAGSSSYFDRDSYLRADGRVVVAVSAWDAPDVVAEAIERATAGNNDVWVWAMARDGKGAREAFRAKNAVWVAPGSGTAAARFDPRAGRAAVVSLPLAKGAKSVPAEQLSSLAAAQYIVIDSFNDWNHGVTLEPSPRDRSQVSFIASVRSQLDAITR